MERNYYSKNGNDSTRLDGTKKHGRYSFSSDEMQRYFSDPEFRRKHIHKAGRLFRKNRLFLYGGILIGVVFLTWYSIYVISGLPSLEELENPKPELATKSIRATASFSISLHTKTGRILRWINCPPV